MLFLQFLVLFLYFCSNAIRHSEVMDAFKLGDGDDALTFSDLKLRPIKRYPKEGRKKENPSSIYDN